jgi:hypothetical protein
MEEGSFLIQISGNIYISENINKVYSEVFTMKIISIVLILSTIIIGIFLTGCTQKVNCLSDEECFKNNVQTCSKATYSQCSVFGNCYNAEIIGEEGDSCIIRNWESKDDKVTNYDVSCTSQKNIRFTSGSFDSPDIKNGKYISPAYICKHD